MIERIRTYDGTDEWKAFRHNYIGGSDAACVVGMNPYKSALGLWAEKTGRVEPFAGNISTECGHVLEPLVAKLWCEKTGKRVKNENCTYVNTDYPYACANIDRKVIGEKAFLEIKTTTSVPIMRALRRNDEEFPVAYYCQCVHYMAVTGYRKCYLAVLVNNRELFTYELNYEDVAGDVRMLMQMEFEFWKRYVLGDEMPDADESADAAKVLSELYPEDEPGKEVNLGADSHNDIAMFLDRKKQIAEKKKEQDLAQNRLKQAMGDAATGYCGLYTVTWKADKNGTRRFNVKENN